MGRGTPHTKRCAHSVWGTVLMGGHIFVYSFLCCVWFLLRSGTKPSRVIYPCQRAALSQSGWCVGYLFYGVGLLVRRGKSERACLPLCTGSSAGQLRVASLVCAAALVGTTAVSLLGLSGDGSGVHTVRLSPPPLRATVQEGGSDIFVVADCPKPSPDGADGSHEGLDALLGVMAEHGLRLYQTTQAVPWGGPEGLIRADDIVVVKINYQWDERGGTNTDVLKGLMRRIVEHPDGFTGEVVVVENIQTQPQGKQITDFQYAAGSNAELRSQSPRAVIEALKADGYAGHVSGSFWANFRHTVIDEDNHTDDGYVHLGGSVAYPKFTTENGHRIDLRHGVWNGSFYEDRIKFINMPVLKDHGLFGVTAASKNYVGVPTVHYMTFDHSLLNECGFLGRMMVHVRHPDVNILDAIYINAHGGGPATTYDVATNVNILLASTDPVALDYYGGKYVLFPVSGQADHDPDAHRIFREYLQATADTLGAYGFRAAMGDSAVNAYVINPFGRPDLRYRDCWVDDAGGNGNGELNRGETANVIVVLENGYFGAGASGVMGTVLSEDEEIALIDAVSRFSDISAKGVGDNSSDPFVLSASADCSAHWSQLRMIVEADGGYVDTVAVSVPVGDPVILLVDDDGGEDLEGYYKDAVQRSGHIYSQLERRAKVPSDSLVGYETIVWFTGACRESTLTAADQSFLTSFLERGGSLFLSGQNIGADLVGQGHGPDFYAASLRAEYRSDGTDEAFLYGVQGDPISGQLSLLALDEGQSSPSVIAPGQGASPVFVYYLSRQPAAITYEGDCKVVYLAFGFEGIRAVGGDDDEVRARIMGNILDWFRYVPLKGDVTRDGTTNILDVVAAVNIILGAIEPTPTESWAADCTDDGLVNVIDVVGIVNVLLGIGTCPPTGRVAVTPATLDYLHSLQACLSAEDFAALMALVGETSLPTEYALSQNYPNPFNATTSIQYLVVSDQSPPHVTLTIFNLLGQKVRTLVDGVKEPGSYTVTWDGTDASGSNVPSGVYFYRLTASGTCRQTGGNLAVTRRMVLME